MAPASAGLDIRKRGIAMYHRIGRSPWLVRCRIGYGTISYTVPSFLGLPPPDVAPNNAPDLPRNQRPTEG